MDKRQISNTETSREKCKKKNIRYRHKQGFFFSIALEIISRIDNLNYMRLRIFYTAKKQLP